MLHVAMTDRDTGKVVEEAVFDTTAAAHAWFVATSYQYPRIALIPTVTVLPAVTVLPEVTA